MTHPDFDQLALAAHPQVDELGPIEALDALWRSLFELDQWFFLGEPKTLQNALEGAKPFRWDRRQDGQKWLLLFTDLERARLWKEKQDFGDDHDKVHFIRMTPAEAMNFVDSISGESVAGIRFNEGSRFGWMAPLDDLRPIRERLLGNQSN